MQKGFTLIELVIVIIILAILAVNAAPKLINISEDAELAVAKQYRGAMQETITRLKLKFELKNQPTTIKFGASGRFKFTINGWVDCKIGGAFCSASGGYGTGSGASNSSLANHCFNIIKLAFPESTKIIAPQCHNNSIYGCGSPTSDSQYYLSSQTRHCEWVNTKYGNIKLIYKSATGKVTLKVN